MKILIVCSFNKNKISPFVLEQAKSLGKNIKTDFYTIVGRGFIGYLKNFFPLLTKINKFQPDIIHAHYGLSGLLANMQRKVPVITTFHGSDINNPHVYKYTRLANKLSSASIFVNQSMATKGIKNNKFFIIPCAVDMSIFKHFSKREARLRIGFDKDDIIFLFSSSFANKIKNYPLAKKACNILQERINQKVNLIELINYSRENVNLLLNCADSALLTSFSEGSPQFVKEAMACNCPIVATDVGDIKEVISETEGCFITSFEAADVAEKIKLALDFAKSKGRTNGRQRIIDLRLDSESVARQIIKIYNLVQVK